MHDGRRRSARPDLHRSRRPIDPVVRWNQHWLVESCTREELEETLEHFFVPLAEIQRALPMEMRTQMTRTEVFWLYMFAGRREAGPEGENLKVEFSCECSPRSCARDFIDENGNAGVRIYGMIETSFVNRNKRLC